MAPATPTLGKREEFEGVVAALNARDFDALAELLHPEASGAVLTWRDGKLWRNVVYSDPPEALAAAGVPD